MNGDSSESYIQCNEPGGLGESPSWNFERMKSNFRDSDVMEHPDKTNKLLMEHIAEIQPLLDNVARPLRYPVNEGSQSSPCTGSSRMLLDYPLNFLESHTAAFGVAPLFFDCQFRPSQRPTPSRLPIGNDGLELSGYPLKACPSQPVMVDWSNVYQRRFVMFDDSGNDKRMVFHPSLMNSFATALPLSSLQKTNMDDGVLASEKYPDGKNASLFRASVALAPCIPLPGMPAYCGFSLGPHHAAKDSMSSTSGNHQMPHFSDADRVGVEIKTQFVDGSPEPSYLSHENTEDIEALLSSDVDEVSSTGHSPSHLTKNHSSSSGPSNLPGNFSAKGMKRKREEDDDHDDVGNMDDDICSTATSGNKANKHAFSQNVVNSGEVAAKELSPFQRVASMRTTSHNLAQLDMPIADEVISNSSGNNKKQCKKMQGLHRLPRPSVPTDLSRKEKIKNILRLLRGVIPGGECMDTAFVLDEAIQYVRTLQSEVHKLQAKKFVQVPK